MKQGLQFLVMFSLFFYGCNEVPEAGDAEMAGEVKKTSVAKGHVEFGFNSIIAQTSKATEEARQSKTHTTSSTIKDQAAEVLLSIVDASDAPIYTNEIVTLVRVGDDILSLPLSFTPGDYKIVLFQVLDASHTAIAMTPQASSELSGLVSNPLAVDFTITAETTERVNLEVLPTAQQSAGDFGYSTFSFTEIRLFPFLLSVFAYDTETANFEPTPARVAITHMEHDQTYYEGDYEAETLTFQIPETQPTDLIAIEVSKDGYQSQTLTATIAELKTYFEAVPQGNGPMIVILLDEGFVTEGLVFYYDVANSASFSNSDTTRLRDISGNGHHATIYGANYVEEYQGGLQSDGASKPYITVGNDPAYNAIKNITLEAWVKRGKQTGGYDWQYIFSNTRDCCGKYKGYAFMFRLNKLGFQVYNQSSTYFYANKQNFKIGDLHHLVVSFDGETVSFYINGVLDSTHTTNVEIGVPSSYPLLIGNMYSTQYFANTGVNYMIRLYDRTLSGKEILKNYNSSKSRFSN